MNQNIKPLPRCTLNNPATRKTAALLAAWALITSFFYAFSVCAVSRLDLLL